MADLRQEWQAQLDAKEQECANLTPPAREQVRLAAKEQECANWTLSAPKEMSWSFIRPRPRRN